jgi:long-chain acyl-CoA synthetase
MNDYTPSYVPIHPEYSFGLRPLHEYIRIHAKRCPNKTCLIYYGCRLTYGQLNDAVDRLAAALKNLKVAPGDAVGIFMQNCPQFVIAFFAIQRLGAIPVPVDPMLKEWELELRVRAVGMDVLFANSYLYPVAQPLRESGLLQKGLVITPLDEYLPAQPEIDYDVPFQFTGPMHGVLAFRDLLNHSERCPESEETNLDEVGMIMFTSGSSGLPKGAMLSKKASVYKAARYSAMYQYHEHNVWLQTQGIYHIGGFQMLATALYNGSTIVLIAKLSLPAAMQAIHRYRCDCWYASCLTYSQILDHPDCSRYNLCSLRRATAVSFGLLLNPDLEQRWAQVTNGGTLVESGYGLTETHTAVAGMPLDRPVTGTYGVPLFGWNNVKIVDGEYRECAPEEQGEIIVKNNGVFLGYLNNETATNNVLIQDWIHTGDVGAKTRQGYLLFFGRKKEMIKSSGFSVFPEEVELFLRRHEAVEEAAVIGKPDTRRGEIVKAFVVLKPEYRGKITQEDFLAWGHDKMAPYKRPREVEFIDALPTTSTGKVMRKELLSREFQTPAG